MGRMSLLAAAALLGWILFVIGDSGWRAFKRLKDACKHRRRKEIRRRWLEITGKKNHRPYLLYEVTFQCQDCGGTLASWSDEDECQRLGIPLPPLKT